MAEEPRAAPNRRQVLKGVGVLGGVTVLGGAGVAAWRASSPAPAPSTQARTADRDDPGSDSELDSLAGAIRSGGPGKDGIPAIDEPVFVATEQADFLADDDPVFGLDYHGQLRAYPQQVLVWHEIVNDTVAGKPLSVTYCPLTGTVVGFVSPPGDPLTFGTTGNLVNSNLLMYDRQTDSEWPQILGTAIRGERKGQRLDTVPLVWSTWQAWRELHPETDVLSTDTGALRDYGVDPYGSYREQSGYYVSDQLYFPVQRNDDRFPPKEVVVGIRAGDDRLAIHKELVRAERTVDAKVGGTSAVARWDDDLDTVRVVDAEHGEVLDSLDAMWFAWYAFYPATRVRS